MEMSLIHQNAGDCIARLLTKAITPAKPFFYRKEGDHMQFTNSIASENENENDDDAISFMLLPALFSIEPIPPELDVEPLQIIDYRNPDVTSLDKISSVDLETMAIMDVPRRLRERAVGQDSANENFMDQPSYWKKIVEFMDQRTPAFIQKVRDEISRRYVILTFPYNPQLERQFFEAMEQCRLSGALTNLQRGVNARQRRVEYHGITEFSRYKNIPFNVNRIVGKLLGPSIKSRRGRKTRKARRTYKRK
jgi:hypothetical protein